MDNGDIDDNLYEHFAGKVTKDITLVAQWEIRTIKLTLDLNGGIEGSCEDSIYLRYGDNTAYFDRNFTRALGTIDIPSRNGYEYIGFYGTDYANDNEDIDVLDENGYFVLQNWWNYWSTDQTIYAQWLRNQYTISYNANGGTGSVPSNQTVYYDWTATISFSPLPTRTGYTFLGWSLINNATAASYTSSGTKTLTMPNRNLTMYAVWKVNTYTVTYNANGGSGAPGSQTKTHGTNLTLSSTAPTRSGYVFLGWSTSSSATAASYSAGGTFDLNYSVTLYAVWKKTSNPYTLNKFVATPTKFFQHPAANILASES